MAYEKEPPPDSEAGFKEAERRIAAWKQGGYASVPLELSRLKLSALPESLGQLKALKWLSLSGNQLSALPESLGQLKALIDLDLRINQLSSLPDGLGQLQSLQVLDLESNQLSSLPDGLGQLQSLQRLYLQNNQLSSLPESIGLLKILLRLELSNNQLSALPESLGQLQALQKLYLSNNQLSALPESLGQLKMLRELYLQYNQLSSLPKSLGQLKALEQLDLRNNLLSALPESLFQLQALQILFLHGNPELGIHEGILGATAYEIYRGKKDGANPQTILNFYFERQKDGRPLNEVKLMLVGRGEAGKTSISRALRGETFDKEQRETPGIEIQDWELSCPGGDEVTVHLWDLAGQEITHETHRFFLTHRSLYLVVLDGRSGQQMEDAEYWLSHVKRYGSSGEQMSPVIVVLNKWASPGPYELEMRRLQREFPNIRAFVKTDCKNGLGITELRETISAVVGQMDGVRMPWPATYARVRKELDKLVNDPDPAKRRHFLTWTDYQKICKQCEVKEVKRQHALAETLNALGLALYYGDDSRLRDTRVLNPNWAANGLYGLVRGVNAKPFKGKRGHLWAGELGAVLKAGMEGMDEVRGASIEHYPEQRDGVAVHEFLLNLMVDRELGFEAGEVDGKPVYLLPGLLSVDEPEVKDFDVAAHIDKAELRFRYLYELLPAGVMSRLIVRTHTLSENLHRWQRGVVLEWGNARALVMAERRRNPRVDVFIAGGSAAERQDLAGVVRTNMEEIHAGLPDGLRGKEELDLTLPGEQYENVEKLIQLEAANKPVQVVTSTGPQDLPVTPELEQVQPAKARDPLEPKLRLFISYSHLDYKEMDKLEPHLNVLKNRGNVAWWYDGKIRDGQDWDNRIREELKEADIVVLLISTKFFASDYIRSVELMEARRMQQAGEAEILPVLLEKCGEFEDHQWLKKLQSAPVVNGRLRPLNSFNPRSNGLYEVEQALRRMIAEVAKRRKVLRATIRGRMAFTAAAHVSYDEPPSSKDD